MTRRRPGPDPATSPAAAVRGQRAGLRSSILVALAGLLAVPAAGHEFWIEPATFTPEVGQPVDIRLFAGDGFDRGRPYARNPRHLESFFVAGEERQPIPGVDGVDPAGRLVAGAAGTLVIGYESRASAITLEAGRFEAYLRAEGLERVVAERRARGESEREGREAFSRAAKSLLRIDGAAGELVTAAGFDRRLGLELEIVPQRDPFTLVAGEPLPVLVLHRGAPLADAQVRVFLRGRPEATFVARTDTAGRAALSLEGEGVWLLSVVHMERAEPETDVDWLSTWASLTFSTTQSAPALRGRVDSSIHREEYLE